MMVMNRFGLERGRGRGRHGTTGRMVINLWTDMAIVFGFVRTTIQLYNYVDLRYYTSASPSFRASILVLTRASARLLPRVTQSMSSAKDTTLAATASGLSMLLLLLQL